MTRTTVLFHIKSQQDYLMYFDDKHIRVCIFTSYMQLDVLCRQIAADRSINFTTEQNRIMTWIIIMLLPDTKQDTKFLSEQKSSGVFLPQSSF